MKDFVRRGRSNSASGQSSHSMPRMSILPSVKLPSLRRQDPNEPPSNNKSPLLTLHFTSRSFLDSSVEDSETKELLYHFKTVGTSTTISRTDPKDLFVKMASIKWPRSLPTKTGKDYTDGILIQMKNARWYGGETMLSLGANRNSSRRFNIPNYSHHMKWKRYGNTYWCTTVSVKGPVATLDATKGPDPLKLTIYETLHDKFEQKALSGFKGVSVLLLDYLLVTAMLLVTDLQEWMLVRKVDGQSVPDLNGQGPSFTPDIPFRSDPRLRKFMYGEPIYPKLSGEGSRLSEGSSPLSPNTPGLPRTPTTPESIMPSFTYHGSDMSSPPPSSPKATLRSVMTDTDDDDFDDISLPDMRPRSIIAESIRFSSSSGAPPSHTYIDPTFYGSESPPPVPPLPVRYAKSFNGRNFSSQPSTPVSGNFPSSPEPHLLPSRFFDSRSRSTSPLGPSDFDSRASTQYSDSVEYRHLPSIMRSDSIQSSASTSGRPVSTGRRPLPRPPPVPPTNSTLPIARRVQSSSQLANYPVFPRSSTAPPRPQRSLPPTPGFVPPSPNPPSRMGSPDPYLSAQYIRQPPIMKASQEDLVLVGTSSPVELPDTYLTVATHSRQPPITKASQEDLANYVHSLTSPQRDLPPAPLPSSSIFDVPPPSYNSINFSRGPSQHRRAPRNADVEQVANDVS
ncbi:hypothetical protein GALMADRAFT_1080978 [Galerina marginata CBS 339.88]|uniref:Uncharacterized protein n=1 Tax=Galerina marginata (strain CBS 339.88) TaxID=685588 RepID=A0A067S9P3_GALM3|nr:hypothetical protein GALMADRAFT_1080978 [Galerina marginata CBS 339.88]